MVADCSIAGHWVAPPVQVAFVAEAASEIAEAPPKVPVRRLAPAVAAAAAGAEDARVGARAGVPAPVAVAASAVRSAPPRLAAVAVAAEAAVVAAAAAAEVASCSADPCSQVADSGIVTSHPVHYLLLVLLVHCCIGSLRLANLLILHYSLTLSFF